MVHPGGRPFIPGPLKELAVREKIVAELAKYKTMEEVHELLGEGVPFHEFEHFFGLDTQQDLVEQARHDVAEKLPISSQDWCLIRLNEIAVNKDASAAEVLSAIRTRNALLKASATSDQDFIDSVTGGSSDDALESTE